MRLAFAALLSLLPLNAAADPVVVELFTSQGCSSCPPADEMLGELAERGDVIALSLHVDYWDWIGWADTFADPAHTARQRAYAAAAGSTVVYTPQFVIGGATQIAGPRGMKLMEAVRAHQDATGDVLGVDDAGRLTLAETGAPARLILATVLPEAEVAIGRGENAGRVFRYHRIVRDWQVLGEWDGAAGTMTLPEAPEGLQRVVLAQRMLGAYPGPYLGAVAVD